MSDAPEIAALRTEVAIIEQQLLHVNELRKCDAKRAAELLAVKDDQLQFIKRALTQALQLPGALAAHAVMPAQNRAVRQRAAAVSVPPLDDDALLDKIFGLVGVGEYFYVAGVCRRWRGRYITLCYNAAAENLEEVDNDELSSKLRTSVASAVITADRLQMAFNDTLAVAQLYRGSFGRKVARYSLEPVVVFALAKQHDLRWDDQYCSCAAAENRLDLLQWLRSRGCPWDVDGMLAVMSRYGKLNRRAMLEWLQSRTRPWTGEEKSSLLWAAVQSRSYPDAEWLREQGAAWPNSFIPVINWVRWTQPMVKYALAHGAAWGDWDCQTLLPEAVEQHMCPRNQQRAKELLDWAHANGCPCTCGQVVA
jgi:hypothetical protein